MQIVTTKKIEIYISDPDERESFFQFFRKNSEAYVQALNLVYSQLVLDDFIENTIKEADESFNMRENDLIEKIKDSHNLIRSLNNEKKKETELKKIENNKKKLSTLRSKKSKEAREILDLAIGLKKQTRSRDSAKKVNADMSDIIDIANMKASKDFSLDFIGIKTGQRSMRNYRYTFNRSELPFRGRDIRIEKIDNKFYIGIPKGYRFNINLGTKPRNARDYVSFLENLIASDSSYKLNQSKITFDGRKFYFNLTVTFEKDYDNLDLNSDKVLKVLYTDAGSGELLINDRKVSEFGDTQYILRFKQRIQALKSVERSRGVYARGGHGRKRKLDQDRWEAIKLRESNFAKTYNNQWSKKIVNLAVRNSCGSIQIVSPDSDNTSGWSYYQLNQFIQQKSEYLGIVCETI